MKDRIKEEITNLTRLIVSPKTHPGQREAYRMTRTVLKEMLNNDNELDGLYDAIESITISMIELRNENRRLSNEVMSLTPTIEYDPKNLTDKEIANRQDGVNWSKS